MLVDPKEVLNYDPLYQEALPSPGMDFTDASGVWVTVRSNLHFIIQRHWESIGAIDLNIPIPFRILHPAEGFKIFVVVSEAKTSQEVLEDWAFLERDLLPTLAEIENPDEATEFVIVTIKSIIARPNVPEGALVCQGSSVPGS